jgi:hypothetical protein
MTKLRISVVALGFALLAGCASTGPSGAARWVEVLPSTGAGGASLAQNSVARWVDSLPSTGAGGASLEQSGVENGQVASETDPCSGSRRMARIRCRW